jgi:HAD superfamily hydrolase (TIGR01484 family)
MEEIVRIKHINTRVTHRGIVITDFDGTLVDSKKNLKEKDHKTLHYLEKAGFIRVIATGRHLYSLFKQIDATFPVDYIIFSSGAGIWDQKNRCFVRMITMEPDEVKNVASSFCELNLDFAVHNPIPDNHYFSYYLKKTDNHDFNRRIHHYKEYASRWETLPPRFPGASQLLSIVTGTGNNHIYDTVCEKLPGFTTIRTTSPMDMESLWIEIFPRVVSKGQTSSWLASLFNLNSGHALAIGNDYNDTDLLSWAGTAFVVSNAPDTLKNSYPTVVSNNECGFTQAVRQWLSEKPE